MLFASRTPRAYGSKPEADITLEISNMYARDFERTFVTSAVRERVVKLDGAIGCCYGEFEEWQQANDTMRDPRRIFPRLQALDVTIERFIVTQWLMSGPISRLQLEDSSIVQAEISEVVAQVADFVGKRTVPGATTIEFRFRFECEQNDFDVLSAQLRSQLVALVPHLATGLFRTAGGSSIAVAYEIEKLPEPLRTPDAISPPPYQAIERPRTPVPPLPSFEEFEERMDLC